MNKFFRLVSMFAIAGVTFAYTSCTDYSEDINKVDGRVDNLQSQFDAFKSATDESIKKIDGLIADLQKTVATLETKEDHKKDVDALNKLIDGLKSDATALAGRVTAIEEDLPNYVKKTDFDETLKGYVKVGEFNTKIGEITGRLDAIEGKLNPLAAKYDSELKISEIISKIDAVKATADDASQKVGVLRTDVDVLQKALKGYTSEGAVSAKFDAIDEEVAKKLNIADFKAKFDEYFQGEFDKAFKEAIRISCAKDGEVDKAIYAALNPAVEALETKISNLNERIDAVLGIIADRLSSIALVPQYYYDGVPAILFETIAYNPLADDKENEKAVAPKYRGNQNSWLVNQFKKYTSAESVAQFRLNPKTVGVDCADFSLVGDKADYVFTRATAPDAPVSIVGTPSYDPKTGYATFKVKKNENINTDENEDKNLDIVALKAVLKKGLTDAEKEADAKPEVYSEFVHVNEIAYTADELAISDKAKLAGKTAGHEYAKTFDEATKNAYVYKMPYDAPFDLKALVATCINSEIYTSGLQAKLDHEALDLEKYDLHYEFSVAQSKYPVTSAGTTTDQQTVIKCVDRLGGIFKVMDANGVEYNQEAIGRTPIVRVDLKHGEKIVTRAFIKLVISVKKASDNISIMDNQKEFVVKCPDTKETMKYDVEKLRKDLYRVLNISHVDFWNLYDVKKAYVKKNGKDLAAFPVPTLVDGIADDGKATKEVYWEFTHGQVGKIGEGAKVEGYLVLKNKLDLYSKYPTTVTFKFTADFRLPMVGKEIKPTVKIKNIFWETSGDNSVLQANVNVPASETDVAANCYFMTPIAEQPWEDLSVTGLPCDEKPMFRIAKVYKDGKVSNAPVAGISLTTPAGGELSITLDKSNDDIKKALNSEQGLQAVIEWYAVYKSGGDEQVLHTFQVNFKRPVNLKFPDDIHVKDAKTGGDEITYGFAGILKDWRGETILPPTPIEIHEEGYYWNKVCSPADHAVVIPGFQKVVKEGYYEFEFEDKEVVIPTATTFYKASITLYDNADLQAWYAIYGDQDYTFRWVGGVLKIVWRPAGTWVEKTTVLGYGRSEAEAIENAKVEANKLSPRYLENVRTRGWASDDPVTEVNINSGTATIKFKTIKNVTYVPAVYETVEPTIEYSPCNPKPGPSSDVYTEGQRIGCWQWQKWATVTPGTAPGRYWDFYGVFTPADDVVLHLDRNPDGSYKHVTTDLPDGKLPSKATLTQKPGYKLFYDNVMSPIQYTYHIYIPASIEYGWGVLNQTLVITVDPYNK